MTYKQALNYLYGLQKYGVKFGLSKTSNLMKRFGNPHHGKAYIHIAGTNGKGSVAAMIESILVRSGLKVGFYSSPHLVRFTERFRINRKEISKKKAAQLTVELKSIIDPNHPPTYFEVTTAMALTYFAREETDIAIMEVGMGGRLDATNIIRPLVSAITNISLEHQFFLGNSLLDIAGEKAGIIKKGVNTVTAAIRQPVISLFERVCSERGAPFWRVGKDVRYRTTRSGLNYYGINRVLKNLETGLKGEFQSRNAALALSVIELLERKGFGISSPDIREGLREVKWPGRIQIISEKPYIILDGAHNPGAVKELVHAIKKCFSYKRLILVLGVMNDKDINRIIKVVAPVSDYVVCASPVYYRSADTTVLMKGVRALRKRGETAPSVSKAISRAKELARPEDLILVTGSLFTVGEALTAIDPVKYKADGI
jgi:dihydrofolate synthase/folylpolyglutamate synthase